MCNQQTIQDKINKNRKLYENHINKLNRAIRIISARKNIKDKYGIEISINPNQISNKEIINFESSKSIIYKNQLETLFDVIEQCLENPSQSGLIIGAPQLGKTMICLLSQIIPPILYIKEDKEFKMLYLAPNKISIESETLNDFKRFNQWYEFDIKNVKNEKSITLQDYDLMVGQKCELNTEEFDISILRRCKGALLEKVTKICHNIHNAGMNVMVVVDEYHYGEDINSLLDQFLHEVFKSKDDFMIAITATPWHLSELDNIWKVKCKTYEGFVGYAFYNGELLDERYPLIIPKHKMFNELINMSLYNNEDSYNKFTKNIRNIDFWLNKPYNNWDEYRNWVEKELVNLINYCLINNPNKGTGMAIRFFKKNAEVDSFLNRIYKLNLNKKIVVKKWNEDAGKMSIDSFLEKENISKETPVVVFVTGNGRMGNRFSERFMYFADFSYKSSLSAIIQGFPGRASGPKPRAPYIYLSKYNYSTIEQYVKSKGSNQHLTKAPIKNTKLNTNSNHSFYTKSIKIQREDFINWGLADHNDEIQKFVDKELKDKEDLLGRNGDNNRFNNILNTIIGKDMVSILEEKLSLPKDSLLVFSSEDETNSPYVDDDGLSYRNRIGFRRFESDGAENSTLSSDRTTLKNVEGNRRHIVQMHVAKVADGWRWVAIKLRLLKIIKEDNINQNIELTKNSSSYYRFCDAVVE